MNFVKSFDLFGTKAKQLPCTPGNGAPTTTTDGAVGDLYMDTDTGDLYKCTGSDSAGELSWEKVSSGLTVTVPETAEVGQTIVVKSVDSNGKPTAWEAADLPSGGGADLMMFRIDSAHYLAEVGMTWTEWCHSRYNAGQPDGLYTCDGGNVYNVAEDFITDYTIGDDALPTAKIDPSHVYKT